MERASLPYVLLGVAAAGERRSRDVLWTGTRAAGVAARPLGLLWRSRLTAPIRARTHDASSDLARDGRALVQRTGSHAREAGVELLRRLGDQLAESGLADELVEWLLGTGAFDHVVTVVINHPATETLVVNALDDPGLDRLLERILDSRMVDELTARLLASDELQQVIDYVIRLPELRAALTLQTAGLADDVAVGVRARTVRADDAAERLARALLRRPRRRPEME